MKKTVIKIHKAVYSPISDLITWRAIPSPTIEYLDPFLFLNHHGPQVYGPNNRGLPFGPHPHRGFETLTFILSGDISHKDSAHGENVIKAGGIQWMTAGRGLIHSEVSSQQFLKEGGKEEVLQLWMNLPSKYKMVDPAYIGLQKEEIPKIEDTTHKNTLHLISGNYQAHVGPINALTDLFTSTLEIHEGGAFSTDLPENSQVFLYLVNGNATVNNEKVSARELVQLSLEGNELDIVSKDGALFLYCYGSPFNEPKVSHGPFVMNTEDEIHEAIRDYQSGKFGHL